MKKSIRTVTEPTHEEIERLAYTFYEESGRQDGNDAEHWLQARAHLCTDVQHTVSTTGKPKDANEPSSG